MLKRLVEIAAVAVAQHGSNFFDGKIGVIEQQVCFSHSRFKQTEAEKTFCRSFQGAAWRYRQGGSQNGRRWILM